MSVFTGKYAVIVGSIIMLTGCSATPAVNPDIQTPVTTVIPSPVSTTSTDRVKTKKAQVQELVMKMETNSLIKIQSLLPDLRLLKAIPADSMENIMQMGPETWYYSQELNQIIAVCDAIQAPMHVFEGEVPKASDINLAKNMMKEMSSMMASERTMMAEQQAAAQYMDYSEELYNSLQGKKPFVLFFHAPWCPTCRKMEKEIMASLASFPKGTMILKVDYDTEVALKKAWGVQVQSTIVVLNAKGENVFKGTDPGIAKMKESIINSL